MKCKHSRLSFPELRSLAVGSRNVPHVGMFCAVRPWLVDRSNRAGAKRQVTGGWHVGYTARTIASLCSLDAPGIEQHGSIRSHL
ncbi:UNVERIFIED_CONTAM: hypothetical protein FKN15_032780 [Acipenser sinensis]